MISTMNDLVEFLRAFCNCVILGFPSGIGGGNIMSSLTLFRGTGLGFTFSHFPVLGGGVGLFQKIEPIDLLYYEVLARVVLIYMF